MTEVERITSLFFHVMFFMSDKWNRGRTRWLGEAVYQNPMDMWAFQEVIWETQPDVIVETGSCYGGSALFFATILDHKQTKGRVISVDIQKPPFVPNIEHPLVTFIKGDSSDPKIAKQVTSKIKKNDRVMVVLDSEHTEAHVIKELNLYAPLVTPGCYLVVCDTNLGGNPISMVKMEGDEDAKKKEKGPLAAVQRYLKNNKNFEVDVDREEKFFLTFFPSGWLRRREA
jgi:cephalosporin hydroxylase